MEKEKINFDQVFFKLIKTYILVFVLTFLGYTFLNWYLTIKTQLLEINEKYVNYWIPIGICYLLTFFIFNPLVKDAKLKEKATRVSLWLIIPFSIGIPLALSQIYFKDKSYSIISVDKPNDILNYKNERFFKINDWPIRTK